VRPSTPAGACSEVVPLTKNLGLTAENLWYRTSPVAATTSSPNTFLSSPRNQRLLMWISGAVLVIGLGIFLGVFFSRGTAQAAPSATISTPASDTNPYENGNKSLPTVPASKTALQVARTFVATAVARKNLDVAYKIVGPALKAGVSRKEWLKGNNPVPYYPAKNVNKPDITVHSSTKNQLLLEVGLVSAPHSGVAKSIKSLGFQMEVDRIHGKWLVTYFLADYKTPVLPSPNSN